MNIEHEIIAIKARINKLQSRATKDNGHIIKKLKRRLTKLVD